MARKLGTDQTVTSTDNCLFFNTALHCRTLTFLSSYLSCNCSKICTPTKLLSVVRKAPLRIARLLAQVFLSKDVP